MKYFVVAFLCLVTGGMYGYSLSNIVSVQQKTVIKINGSSMTFDNNRHLEGDVFEIYKNGTKVASGKMIDGMWRLYGEIR